VRLGRTRAVAAIVACAALVGGAAAGASAASRKPQKVRVGVFDNYYKAARSPAGKLTVNRNSAVTFVWGDTVADVHDVRLVKGPKGVKGFTSDPSAAGFEFTNRTLRKLAKPGVYTFICTFHESDGMTFTLTVRR
jgi:plastocyanin